MLNRIAHDLQIGGKRSFLGSYNRMPIVSGVNRSDDHNNREHNHQFDQRESAVRCAAAGDVPFTCIPAFHCPTPDRDYQSEYLVPFKAVPEDLVNTSKTS